MVKRGLILGILLAFSGCGDNNATVDDNNLSNIILSNDTNTTQYRLELEKTQWYATYDENFYTNKGVDENASIHGDEVYSKYTGKGVKVAIIDNGFDMTHPELQGRVIAKINCTGVGVSDDIVYAYEEGNYHGTACAGIIGAAKNDIGIRGIAPNSELILIKMASSNTDAQTIAMFQKAVDAGADIISCSWGTYDVSDTVRNYINKIATDERDGKGVIVVFASGNDNQLMGNDESTIKNVLGVGATDHKNLRTSYSNYGQYLDIVAPGGGQNYSDPSITTLDIVGSIGASNTDYNLEFIGTSASAPVVAGALALVLEAKPNITRVELQELLKSTSDKIGLSLPYLVDYEVVDSSKPKFYGTLGDNNYKDFSLYIKSLDNNITYGAYSISVDNNNWSVAISDELPEGYYQSTLIANNIILATDYKFEVDLNRSNIIHSTRNDYYGYGKINLQNLINSVEN